MLQNGVQNEFVYAEDSHGASYKLSELNWSVKNNSNIGGRVSVGFKIIRLECMFFFGIPAASGSMYDSDWQLESDHSIKTDYSVSENTLKTNINVRPRLVFDLQIFDFWNVCPYVNYRYDYTKFSARNGYGWYGSVVNPMVSYDDSSATYYASGRLCGVDYERESMHFMLGCATKFLLFERLTFLLDFGVGIFSSINSLDTHYSDFTETAGNNYLDSMYGFFKAIDAAAAADFKIYKGLSIGIGYEFFAQFQTEGVSYYKSLNAKKYSSAGSTAQASEFTHEVSVFVRYGR